MPTFLGCLVDGTFRDTLGKENSRTGGRYFFLFCTGPGGTQGRPAGGLCWGGSLSTRCWPQPRCSLIPSSLPATCWLLAQKQSTVQQDSTGKTLNQETEGKTQPSYLLILPPSTLIHVIEVQMSPPLRSPPKSGLTPTTPHSVLPIMLKSSCL